MRNNRDIIIIIKTIRIIICVFQLYNSNYIYPYIHVQWCAMMVIFDWVTLLLPELVVWRYVFKSHGVLSVMETGKTLMHLLPAGS